MEQFAQNIHGYYIHVLSHPAPALGFICSLSFQVPQECAGCFAQACTPQLTSSPGQLCSPGAFSQGKAEVAEKLQAGSQQRAGHGRTGLCTGAECLVQDTIPSRLIQRLLFHVVALQGFTFWERENHLAEEFHIEAIGKLFYIIQPHHWSEVLVTVIEFSLLCPVQG